MTDKTPVQILTDAANLIESGRWTKGSFVRLASSEEGQTLCFCAVGAIDAASMPAIPSTLDEWNTGLDYIADGPAAFPHDAAMDLAREASWKLKDDSIANFNDLDTTTAADVVALLREAAKV